MASINEHISLDGLIDLLREGATKIHRLSDVLMSDGYDAVAVEDDMLVAGRLEGAANFVEHIINTVEERRGENVD